MPETIKLKSNKGILSCDVPINKEQWLDILRDKEIVGPVWMRLLLSFYYMPGHRATCTQCAKQYGQSVNTYVSGVTALSRAVIDKLGSFQIVNDAGEQKYWPVLMGEGKPVKGAEGVFQWTLRPELVDALREYILSDALNQYADDFKAQWKREDYKWKALKIFQNNWDLDAPDFADMLARALAQHKNLLDTSHAFPKSVLVEVAQEKPELVREMFRNLYNEDLQLESRISDFIKTAELEFKSAERKSHYQSTNAVSVYLWFRYPNKYYIYKWGEYNEVVKKIGFDNGPKANGLPTEVIKGYAIYDELQTAISLNKGLQEEYESVLAENPDKYFKPEGLATLTFDFGFWISRFYKPLIATRLPKVWAYAPGEGADIWEQCQAEGIVAVGWKEIGDLSSFETKDELDQAMDEVYPDTGTTQTNSKLCLWEFGHGMAEGDIVYVKQGLYKIIGRGIIEGGYEFDSSKGAYPHIRKIKWDKLGEWDVRSVLNSQLPQKTLTDMTSDPEWRKKIDNAIENTAQAPVVVAEPENGDSDVRYWWLVASPKYWSFSEKAVGETVEYTVKNDKGNFRIHAKNFENARVGDLVVGYEAYPTKKIVAIAKVAKESNGETITYEILEKLDAPISWFDFKDLDSLRNMQFLKNRNGSFFKLTSEEYEIILDLIRQDNPEPEKSNLIVENKEFSKYSKEQFLSEVFMTEEKLEELMHLLRLKKNVILQGAPGVGKTFSAKRIAYCMMGEKDNSRIEMVQFHQNYSYEDFIMGYRPTENGGFELRTGSFYNFCKKAEEQPDKDYFFIIDEINRGNLSKIFGELLMLVENSYRGHAIKLAYRNEMFSVPENLYIIGMMNTADRSLAMIDYALRRRFSFHSMTPGFDTEGFKTELKKHADPRVAKVVEAVKTLNGAIAKDDSLGEGFCIGHSYFCGQPTGTPWIDHVVRYDICPMLDEYWFDSKEKCNAEKSRLLDLLK